MLRIQDIMSRKVHTVSPDTDVVAAAQKMKRHKVSAVIVMKGNKPVGIVTEKDISEKVVAEEQETKLPVKAVMSSPLYITNPDREIVGIASIMEQLKIKKIPVMQKGKLIGIVTETDILNEFIQEITLLKKDLNKEKIDIREYNKKTLQLIDQVNETIRQVKMWHMKCLECGAKFYAEDDQGVIKNQNCPECGSFNVEYDKKQDD